MLFLKKNKTDYDLIVIGAGSGGLTAAIGGAQIGAKTLLVEKEKIGGDCTHYGCIPSKTLIKASQIAHYTKELKKYWLIDQTEHTAQFSVKDVLKKVNNTVQDIYEHETPAAIKELGVQTIIGAAQFTWPSQIKVNDQTYSAKKIVIATGSRAMTPHISGIEQMNYLTNQTIFTPRQIQSLVVVGGGPIGIELTQAFARLGVTITLIHRSEQILKKEESKASQLLSKQLKKDGVQLFLNQDIVKITEDKKQKEIIIKDKQTGQKKTIITEQILFAIGRRPNIEGLKLDKAGIKHDSRGIFINNKTQASNPSVYAIGDVARQPQFTHYANHMGKVALTNIIFKFPAKIESQIIPRVTYTSPEIASVGLNADDLKKDPALQKSCHLLHKDYSQIDRAITDSDTNGYFSIIVDKKGYILGATLVGQSAGELIGEVALAMKAKIKITTLSDTIHPYPTYGYGLRNAADQFRALGFTNKKKALVKWLFRLRGE